MEKKFILVFLSLKKRDIVQNVKKILFVVVMLKKISDKRICVNLNELKRQSAISDAHMLLWCIDIPDENLGIFSI